MYSRDIQSLLRVKQVIDHLKAIDTAILTEAELEAVRDSLQQAYDRAAYALQAGREYNDGPTTDAGYHCCCCYP